jgi:hypothetical protein
LNHTKANSHSDWGVVDVDPRSDLGVLVTKLIEVRKVLEAKWAKGYDETMSSHVAETPWFVKQGNLKSMLEYDIPKVYHKELPAYFEKKTKILGHEIGKPLELIHYGPVSDDEEFDDMLYVSSVFLFLSENDRTSLVRMFSRCCPYGITRSTIEFDLVRYGNEYGMKDAITILFESYGKTTDPANKETIFNAISHGFKYLKFDESDKDRFVKTCEKWYSENKDVVKLNWEYWRSHSSLKPAYEKYGLFVKAEPVPSK